MRIFYFVLTAWSGFMLFQTMFTRHMGIFTPMFFLIFLLLMIWSFKKYRKVSAEHRRRSKAWRRDPNNWSV